MNNELAPRQNIDLSNFPNLVKQYAQAATSENTKKAYQRDWRHFVTWCQQRRVKSLPADVATLTTYISHMAQDGYKVSTIKRRMVSISRSHQAQGQQPQTGHPLVRSVLEGITRQNGSNQRQVEPINTGQITQWIETLNGDLKDIRDKALILVGYAGAFRRSELVSLDVDDIRFTPQGMIITVSQSKTDQHGQGQTVGIPYGENVKTCPVNALRAWLDASGIKNGPIFRSFWKGNRKIKENRITPKIVALTVKRMVSDLGLDPVQYSGHSLRAGHATQAVENGCEPLIVMDQTRHKSEQIFRKYVRRGNLFTQNSAKHLGL